MPPSIRTRLDPRVLARAVCLSAFITSTTAAAYDAAETRSFADKSFDRATRAAATVWHGAQDLGQFALGLIGVEYRYGGDTPARGLDCSGLIRYVFQQVTGVTLPRSAREMSRVGTHIGIDDLQAGDLVFFNTRNFAFSHVGLYLGEDRFIHAPRRGRDVEVSTLSKSYWQHHFSGARRLVGVLPALIPAVIPEALAATPLPADEAGNDWAATP